MKSSTAAASGAKISATPNYGYINEGLSTRKTAIIIVTVVGCIAILWPKVFYPMMFGGTSPKVDTIKDQKFTGGCCDVVLDREKFFNTTTSDIGAQLYRKRLNLLTDGEISIRQERPSHIHPESIYQSMRERGRAIAATPIVPIIEKAKAMNKPAPRIVEGRPGPIPGMRPPLGAGSFHQAQPKGSGMGFIMPLYTIGIVVFFIYTIMKIAFKKPVPNAPYGPAPVDPNFRKEVFGQDSKKSVDDKPGTKLGSNQQRATCSRINAEDLRSNSLSETHQEHSEHSSARAFDQVFNKETEQLMEIEKLRRKLEDTERAMAKLIAEMNSDQNETKEQNKNMESTSENIINGQKHSINDITTDSRNLVVKEQSIEDKLDHKESDETEHKKFNEKKEGSAERSVKILGVEVTASCEGGQKWAGGPLTPVFFTRSGHSTEQEESTPEPQSIYLEGSLAHESQILVTDSETNAEEIYDKELNGSAEEPAVVLSSKMTLSLININSSNPALISENDIESPLGDDIEIIGHDD